MKKFILMTSEEKKEVFQSVSFSMGMRPDIIEKDFWVCFMLNHLFHNCKYKDAFVFKGGTSLSKAYHLIERFSEDIDIILDWRKVVPQGDDPWADRTKNKQDRFNKAVNTNAAKFFSSELAPSLNKELEKLLGEGHWISVDEDDELVINFFYPQIFEVEYLRDKVRLEIGPLAEWIPSHETRIQSFVSEKYPNLFDSPSTDILTIDVERSFWEKLTILHKMANYPLNKTLPPRYARHLYDVFCMANSSVKNKAFDRKDLLEKDVLFKQKFYYAKSSHYETATLENISLIPDKHILEAVKKDYDAMKNMIYGKYPSFEEILECLKQLESEIHQLQ